MAQLPVSLRQRKAATTSIHDKPPTRMTQVLAWGSWLLLILACAALIFGVYALHKRMQQAEMAHLYIVGVPVAEQQKLAEVVQQEIQGSYFTIDLENIRDRALRPSWVDNVVISRAWPDSVVMRVTPKHAIARWGTGRLLSDDGLVFQPIQIGHTTHLPLLHGPVSQSREMMSKYRDISQMFEPINLRLKELYLTERMTWFMQFDSGLRIIVDQDQTMSKLQRLQTLSKQDLQQVWSQIAAIDLRYRNGLAIQWKNGQPPKMLNGQFVMAEPLMTTVPTAPVP
ncbi:MAG: FtsQ-type POTRA domain-containing protein [Acinetobacter sp.]|jgi:cell division protein FtsQ|nr:MAG: FtsQ-type POTRA domain-containing protein [Acinetobacter sp.]